MSSRERREPQSGRTDTGGSGKVIIDRRTYARHFLGEKKPSDEGESLTEGVSGGSGGRWKKSVGVKRSRSNVLNKGIRT